MAGAGGDSLCPVAEVWAVPSGCGSRPVESHLCTIRGFFASMVQSKQAGVMERFRSRRSFSMPNHCISDVFTTTPVFPQYFTPTIQLVVRTCITWKQQALYENECN
jgi:hypothetical protein